MAEAAASNFLVGDSIWVTPDLACELPLWTASVPVLMGEAE